jgi:hypothetical protein
MAYVTAELIIGRIYLVKHASGVIRAKFLGARVYDPSFGGGSYRARRRTITRYAFRKPGNGPRDCTEIAGQDSNGRDGMTYRIWCKVSGGITGTREAWLKANGKICEYATREQAAQVARDLNERSNRSGATADYRYSVIEHEEL